jgi:hypothetical protein
LHNTFFFEEVNTAEDDSARDFAVLTGLEVVLRVLDGDGSGNGGGNGKVKLEMIPHKSMCHMSSPTYGNSVDLVF